MPKTNMALVAIALVAIVVGGVFVANTLGLLPTQQANQAGQGGQPATVGGGGTGGAVSAYPVDLQVPLKDAANPTTSVTTATVTGRIYSSATADDTVKNALTSYLDSNTVTSAGILNFTGKQTINGNTYKLKIWDNTASPTWYATLVPFTVSSSNQFYSGAIALPQQSLDRIGTFSDAMVEDATLSDGTAITTYATAVNSTSNASYNTLRINISESAATTLSYRVPLVIGQGTVNAKLKNVVMKPQQSTTSGIPVTAFTAASITYRDGVNFFPAVSNILTYVQNQQPITIGELGSGTVGRVYLAFTLDKSSVAAGQSFMFFLDDNSNWLGTDSVAGQQTASPANFTISIVA